MIYFTIDCHILPLFGLNAFVYTGLNAHTWPDQPTTKLKYIQCSTLWKNQSINQTFKGPLETLIQGVSEWVCRWQNDLQSFWAFSVSLPSLYLAGGCLEGECIIGDDNGHSWFTWRRINWKFSSYSTSLVIFQWYFCKEQKCQWNYESALSEGSCGRT